MKFDQTKAFKPASSSEPKGTGFAGRVSEWSTRHPILAIILVSLLAVVVNCYPVVFCGRSYVSPACAGPLVYGWWPPLPEIKNLLPPAQSHRSDTWATMLWGVPVGFIESRSLLQDGKLPLWNRYSHAGDTLIGQAISMLGDPLQFIVILGPQVSCGEIPLLRRFRAAHSPAHGKPPVVGDLRRACRVLRRIFYN